VLAAHIVNGTPASLSTILSVPVFVVALVLVRLLIAVVEARGWESLEPLLVVQFVLLAGYLTCAVLDRDGTLFSPPLVVAGLLGVGAMAAQNAIAQASLRGAPSTAVMTTNLTRFAIDLGEILFVRDDNPVAAARRRAAHTPAWRPASTAAGGTVDRLPTQPEPIAHRKPGSVLATLNYGGNEPWPERDWVSEFNGTQLRRDARQTSSNVPRPAFVSARARGAGRREPIGSP
jgi:Protein of unknown function (DUF1275)